MGVAVSRYGAISLSLILSLFPFNFGYGLGREKKEGLSAPKARVLSKRELSLIRGGDMGSPPPWVGGEEVLGCEGCGEVGGVPSSVVGTDEGNLFFSSLLLKSGGLGLPISLRLYLSVQDPFCPMPYGQAPAIRTNFHMRVLGCEFSMNTGGGTEEVEVIEEDGRRITFMRGADGSLIPPAGHHEELIPRFETYHDFFVPYPVEIFVGYEFKKEGKTFSFDYIGCDEWGNQVNRLSSIRDGNGNTISISYLGEYSLDPVEVKDSAGRKITFSYSGSTTTITDWAGRSISVEDTGSSLIITDANGGQIRLNYEPYFPSPEWTMPSAWKITSIRDPGGDTYTFTYDESGWEPKLRGVINPDGTKKSFSYFTGPQGNRGRLITDEEGRGKVHYYDGEGNLIKVVDGEGNVTQMTYDADHNRTSVTDPNGNTTFFQYNEEGNLIKVKDPMGNVTQYTYDGQNNLTSVTDPLGNTTYYSYDANSNLSSIEDAMGNITNFAYDERGLMTSTTDPLGRTTTFSYDSQGNLISITDPLGNTTQYGYDALGRRISVTDPEGKTTYFAHDQNDRLTQVTHPDGSYVTYNYDCCHLVSVTDENGKVTSYDYDERGRLEKIRDSAGNVTQFSYDGSGNLTSVTDPKGNTISFSYDNAEKLTQITYPDGSTEVFSYEGERMVSWTNQNGETVRYECNANRKLTEMTYPEGETITFSYDSAMQRTEMVDPTGTTSFSYDDLGMMEGVSYGWYDVQYQYDPSGQRTRMDLVKGELVYSWTYFYDDAGRLVAITDPWGKTYNFTYDENGLLTKIGYPHGTYAELSYNERSLLTDMVTKRPDGTIVASFSYSYDNVGNRTAVLENDGTSVIFGYDDLHQLIMEKREEAEGTLGYWYEYTYDANGNRLKKVAKSQTGAVLEEWNYTYDNMNRLLKVVNGNERKTFTYDLMGNTTSITDSRGKTQFEWGEYFWGDYSPRLLKITLPEGRVISFGYNGDGILVRKEVSTGYVREFVYDWEEEQMVGEIDSQGNLVSAYTYGPMGLLSKREPTGSYFYHFDGLGSVVAMTDGGGNVVNSYRYDAWGNILEKKESVENPFQYVGMLGYYRDEESGLYFLQTRYLSASGGRFLSLSISEEERR